MSEMKNTLGKINGGLDTVDRKTNELKDIEKN
jgi:hypothetical protein